MRCGADGKVAGAAESTGEPKLSAGWTPGPRGRFVAGEKYQDQRGVWYKVDPVVAVADDRSAVQVSCRVIELDGATAGPRCSARVEGRLPFPL